MATLTSIIRSSEVEVSRPILGEVAATVADVQVRNRGTIGGNICVNDPTNHFPPLLVALGATMTIRSASGERTVPAEEFFVGVFETAVGEGELLTRISVPTRAGGDGMSGVTLGVHGTYVANAAAVGRRRRLADRARLRRGGAGARDGGRGAARGRRLRTRRPCARRSRGSGRRSTRRPTSTPPRTTGAASPRSRSCAPSSRQPSEQRGERGGRADDEPVRDRDRERRAGRAGGAGAPAARALPARRPRPHGHAHRLRHRELRRLHRAARRRRGEELRRARRPGGRRLRDDGRGPRRATSCPRCSGRSPSTTRSSAATARRGC